MQIVLLSIEPSGPHRVRANVSLDGRLVEHEVEFFPEGGTGILVVDAVLDGTREERELTRLLRAHDEGASPVLPHTVDPEDRWPALPSAGEPRPHGLMWRHCDVVLRALTETQPGLWAADVTVDGAPDRLVVFIGSDPGARDYVTLSPELSSARELRELYRAIVRASQGETLAFPLTIRAS